MNSSSPRNDISLRVGLFGIGLDTYWPQFECLKERLEAYVARVAQKLERPGAEIVNLGLVDNPERAQVAGREFRRADVDLIFLYVTTYALSSTVLPVVRRAKVPVIVLNLVPQPAIDYTAFNALGDRTQMTGDWLAYCSACPVPEISNVFQRVSIPFHQVTGVLEDDPECWREIEGWMDAAWVAAGLANNRLGLMGHYYSGMLDIYSDVTLQCAVFGTHVEILEVDELAALRREVKAPEIGARLEEFHEIFDVQPDCPQEDLREAACTAVALDRLVANHRLNSMAYYYKGTGVAENETTLASIILGTSQLTGRGIPVAGEYEVKNVHAMKILDLFGVGGSFTEYYALDFEQDVVLMGHDGPGHIAIAEGKTKVRPLKVYHGKVGRGVSVEMAVKHGPVTLLSVIERGGGKLALLCAQAESVPGAILEIGNTNSRYRFACGAREFVNRWNAAGPAHHCAVGIGHIADKIEKLGQLLEIETIRVV
ncbi:MAG: arabinose isomerase [Verrucomicrobia bacterium]|nr:arabinose isomerase [Verrucomicrobiota bacterium]